MTATAQAHRVTLYKVDDGWRYRVQSANWRTIEAPQMSLRTYDAARRRVMKKYPNVEIVTED